MINFKFVAGVVGATALVFATSSNAATVFDGVTLHGVQILGSKYDVTFRDGAFDAVFPTGNLTFTTESDVYAALDAILGQAAFQALQLSAVGFSGVIVPATFNVANFYGSVDGGSVARAWYSGERQYDYGTANYTFASFDISAVPEPATWAMMIVGFGAVGSMVRTARRRNAFSAA